MNKLKLVKPSLHHKKSFLKMKKDFMRTGFHDYDDVKDFKKYIAELNDNSHGINLKSGYVPMTTFWLVKGDLMLGESRLRHRLNEKLLAGHGGHIGYGISPNYWRKGYGTKILELTLKKAKIMGLKKVLLTCNKENIASAKIIKKNGGVLKNEIKREGGVGQRYWIKL